MTFSNTNKLIDIRPPSETDASLLMDFGNHLLDETDFYIRRPGERANTPAEMLHIINWYNNTPNQTMLHAWEGDTPVGEVVLMAGTLIRTAKTAQLGIGILKSHQKRGIGKSLMKTVEEVARQQQIHRLEFTVFGHNHAAFNFYCAQGYQKEGERRESVYINGQYYNEIMMGKIL